MMKNSKKENKKMIFYLLALVIAVALAVIFFYFPDKFMPDSDNSQSIIKTVGLIEINKDAIKSLEELKKCGDWPLIQISPNPNRGNPFNKKADSEQVMTAMPEVQCLSVIRN
jgi:hypothetical protein